MIANRLWRVCAYIFGCAIIAVSIGFLVPSRPRVTPIQGYVAAFPNDKVSVIIPYRSSWYAILRHASGIDFAPEATVFSFHVNKRSLSGTINVLISPNESLGEFRLKEVKLHYAGKWYPVPIGNIAFDTRDDTGDGSLQLTTRAITRHSHFEEQYDMSLVNVSSEKVSILDIQAPGVTYLGGPIIVEPGNTVTLPIFIDMQYDLVRPWILYSTPTGEHMMPGASCYRAPD